MVKKITWWKRSQLEKTKSFKRLILEKDEWIKSSVIRINFGPTNKISTHGKSFQLKITKYAIWSWYRNAKNYKPLYIIKSTIK